METPKGPEKDSNDIRNIPPEKIEEAAKQEADIVQERQRRGIETPHMVKAPAEEPKKLSWTEVKTKVDFRKMMEVMNESFPDENDRDPLAVTARGFFDKSKRFYLTKDDSGKSIGMEQINLHKDAEGGYEPFAAITSDYRNQGVFPKMKEFTDARMRELGIQFTTYDFEDDRVIKEGVYKDEDPDEVLARINGRQNFWKRSAGCTIVNDPDVRYCRPSSENTQEVQAYDSLAFRFLNSDDPKWAKFYNEDKTAISREAYEFFYMNTMQLEFSDPKGPLKSKEELRAGYPAIDQFFKQMEAHPDKKWFSVDTAPVRQKATPDANIEIQKDKEQIDERNRWQHVPRNGAGWERPLSAPSAERQERIAQRQEIKLPEPMSEDEMKSMIRKIADVFGTDSDPTQAAPSVEQFKGLQAVDPYSLLLQKDDKGEVIGWSGIVPVSKELADQFADGKINEAQIISAAIEKPGYDALYHWAFYTDPEAVKARPKDSTLDFVEAQLKMLMERHPTIRDHVAWGYSEAGAGFMHKMEQEMGIRIRKSPESY